MTFFDGGGGSQQIRDELGSDADERSVVKVKSEQVKIREGSTIINTRDTSTDTIWGRDDWGGDTWDGSYDNSLVVVGVVNPNNTFVERFRNTQFEDALTSADWDVVNYYVDFTAGQLAQTKAIFLNSKDIVSAKPMLTIDSGAMDIYLTPNGGDTTKAWYEFTNNTSSNFANLSIDLDVVSSDEEVWLKMNDDAATTAVLDYSGNGNDGTASFNTDDNTVTGYVGNALNIPLSTDKIELDSNVSLTGALTVAAWIKKSTYSTHGICGHPTDYNLGRLTFIDSTRVNFWVPAGTYLIGITLSTFPVSTWFHLAVTRDSSNDILVYVNGVDVTSGSPTRSGTVLYGRVADNPDNSSYTALQGDMDDFRLYSRALSATEIEILADAYTAGGDDLRLKLIENNSSTARVSEIKVEYTT
jgi:hypothetical protein